MHYKRISVLSIFVVLSCSTLKANSLLKPVIINAVSGDTTATQSITYKIINSINNTFGYSIYINNKLKVYQPNIPGLPGNNGFKTKDDADKVARLVVDKIKKGETPPSVTPDELKKLNVIK